MIKLHTKSGILIRRHGFTLIELLVVIAIISLLVSILVPSLQKAKLLAQQTACMGNLHGIGIGILMYQHDYEVVPLYLEWAKEYIDNTDILLCPADPYKGVKMLPPGDMTYPYSESRWSFSVPNSYWSLVTQYAAWGDGTGPRPDIAQELAKELTGNVSGYSNILGRDFFPGGQNFAYLSCLEGHYENNVYPSLRPSGSVVLYVPLIPDNFWANWPEYYTLNGF